jgi:hypothetical protein
MVAGIRESYKAHVAEDHKNRTVRAYFDLYAWFWFHTQFWIKDPEQRRPYTFIMRDWIYTHRVWYRVILITWYAGMLALLNWHPYPAAMLLILSSWLAAHLTWGSKWIPGEQEYPPITEM